MSKDSNKIHPLIKIKNILLEDINYRLYKIEMEQKKIVNDFSKIDEDFVISNVQFELNRREYITKHDFKKNIIIFLVIIIVLNMALFVFLNYKLSSLDKKDNFRKEEYTFESGLDNIYNFLLDKKLPIAKSHNGRSIIINSNSLENILYVFLWSYKFRNDYSFLELKPLEISSINKNDFRVVSEFYPVVLEKLEKKFNKEVIFYFEGAYDSFPIFLEDIVKKIFGNYNIIIYYKKIEFSSIYFEKSSFSLLEKEIEKLNKVIFYMNNIPSLNLKIIGHADKSGEDRLNITLSCKRATEVEKFLIKNGEISASRLKIECFSSFKSNSDNPVENRKVEFKFLF